MDIHRALARWHQVAESGSSVESLAEIIHQNAVFHSPVVHTPQEGSDRVVAYLSAAGETLGNDSFRYVRHVIGNDTAVLEFMTEMDGIKVNGIDMITFDSNGLITDFKVMIRPLKAVNKVWELMAREMDRQRV